MVQETGCFVMGMCPGPQIDEDNTLKWSHQQGPIWQGGGIKEGHIWCGVGIILVLKGCTLWRYSSEGHVT